MTEWHCVCHLCRPRLGNASPPCRDHVQCLATQRQRSSATMQRLLASVTRKGEKCTAVPDTHACAALLVLTVDDVCSLRRQHNDTPDRLTCPDRRPCRGIARHGSCSSCCSHGAKTVRLTKTLRCHAGSYERHPESCCAMTCECLHAKTCPSPRGTRGTDSGTRCPGCETRCLGSETDCFGPRRNLCVSRVTRCDLCHSLCALPLRCPLSETNGRLSRPRART